MDNEVTDAVAPIRDYEDLKNVDSAIKALRPKSTFTIVDNKIIEWTDPDDLDAPTWAEIISYLTDETERLNSVEIIEDE